MGSAERDRGVPAFEVFPGEGPPLLLIHGLLSSRWQWQPNLSALSRISRPVVLELWGHGRSTAPAGEAAYTLSSYLAAFEEIRSQIGADHWFVCGQSYGAGLAIHYALRHADRTLGLVFTNSRSALAAGRLHQPRNDLRAASHGGLEALPFHPKYARRFPADLKGEMMREAQSLDLAAVGQGISTTLPDLSARDHFGSLAVPTLLVNGKWEKGFQPDRDFAARALPGLEVADLDGGHSINIEAADAFNRVVADFVISQSRP
ncbi:MAG: alpha/beta fold hydrolase [Myxococcota bacterium]|nr:alpha/beta fold hydrolase [Myxococcota bacterium]